MSRILIFCLLAIVAVTLSEQKIACIPRVAIGKTEAKPKSTNSTHPEVGARLPGLRDQLPGFQADQPTSPTHLSSSPVELPKSPTHLSSSPVERPLSPAHLPELAAQLPGLPAQLPGLQADQPTSPVELPTSPVELPTSPVELPTSPVEPPTSPAHLPELLADLPSPPAQVPELRAELPGRYKSPADQCRERKPYYFTTFCMPEKPEMVCVELYCTVLRGDIPPYEESGPALDGTWCGDNKMCSKGLCVNDPNPPAAPLKLVDGEICESLVEPLDDGYFLRVIPHQIRDVYKAILSEV